MFTLCLLSNFLITIMASNTWGSTEFSCYNNLDSNIEKWSFNWVVKFPNVSLLSVVVLWWCEWAVEVFLCDGLSAVNDQT